MLSCFAPADAAARPAHVTSPARYAGWLAGQSPAIRAWLDQAGFKGKAGSACLLPGGDGAEALLVTSEPATPWDASALHAAVGGGTWRLADAGGGLDAGDAALGWALAAYRFDRYRKVERPAPLLAVGDSAAVARGRHLALAHYLARDLINTPANDLGPAELAGAAEALAGELGASFGVIVGDDLLERNYPLIHAVGRGSHRAPRLVDIGWGDPAAPRLTLVGKGVCFDTGGLDLKPSAGMLMMKKDMGGAALMLATARSVMAAGLPVRLRLLIPAVENSVGGSAFRPLDVIRSRKGLTVEIGNTDAEGRLVLADALAEADREKPALILDAATLTGAARVALGPEIPALFTPDDALAADLMAAAERTGDPVWRLPLHPSYRRMLDSPVADINNVGSKPFAGAVTAALFLKEFVTETKAWAHLDTFAWNDEARPGRAKGGEAVALRTVFAMLEQRFAG
jgi:leucyl aminopeptidase